MKIATWNVNSINIRLPVLLDWLSSTQVDVVCLQETKVVDETFPFAEINAAGYEVAFFGQKSYNGVAIISRYPISDVQKGFHDDDEEQPKRLIAATVNGVRIVNTYVPNGTSLGTDKFAFKLDWLFKLRRFLDDNYSTGEQVLWCGDFNVAPDALDVWNPPAWEGHIHFTKPERAIIHYVKQWGLEDVFRKLNGDVRQYSWWDYRAGAFPKNHGLRIDHIWVSPTLAETCTRCWVDTEPRQLDKPSDHAPVVAEFNL